MASTEFTPTGGGQLKQPDFKIVSGGVYPELAEAVADESGIAPTAVEWNTFPSGEMYARYPESVRRSDLYMMQSYSRRNGYTVNDAFMEQLLMIDAARRASAGELTAVVQLFPYARQDRQSKGRDPISASVVIRCMATVGINRILTIDLHSPQTQGVFNGPFDHLTAQPLIRDEIASMMEGEQHRSVIVSPDAGRAKESEQLAAELDLPMVLMPKSRGHGDSSQISRPDYVDGVGGRVCYIPDDMVDTAGTLVTAAETLKNSGAIRVVACATHGLFNGPATDRIRKSPIDRIVVTDTIPQFEAQHELGDTLVVKSVAPTISQAIVRIATGGSISEMFDGNNYH
jgi:ribose-phosphate pyrophosphokinase